jgi:hypothetical protein
MSRHEIIEVAPHVPTSKTRHMVEGMAACGLDEVEIAYVLKTDPGTVKMTYVNELKHGLALTNAKVGGSLLKQALKGDVNAAKFWLQARAKWVPAQNIEVTGKNGGPIEMAEKQKVINEILEMVATGEKPPMQAPGSTSVN